MEKYLYYDIAPGVEAFSTYRSVLIGAHSNDGTPEDKGSVAILPYPVVQPRQTHDIRIARIDNPMTTRETLEGVDALMTDVPGCAIGIRTADCIPVLLFDPVHRAVASVHAGWRGTVHRICKVAVEAMTGEYGTDTKYLKAVIGPGIGPDSFQVGEEVVEEFRSQGFPMDRIYSWRGPAVKGDMSGGHHIDLWEANRWILEQSNVNAGNISVTGICTYERNDLFFSARREGTSCGRILSAIILR